VSYAGIGWGLIFQPNRFNRTSSYANLMDLLQAQWWGVAYLLISVLFAVYVVAVSNRFYAILVHTFAIMLTGLWLAAFIIRYATDDATTTVNIVSWAVFLFLLIRSGMLIDVSTFIRRPPAPVLVAVQDPNDDPDEIA
jgi:hypothetical protein